MKLSKKTYHEILDKLSVSDCSLSSLLSSYNITPQQFNRFVNVSEETKQAYRAAREARADYIADLLMQESAHIDPINAQVVRTKFEMRRWLLSKMHPRSYADNSNQVNVQINAVQPTLTVSLHHENRKTSELNTAIVDDNTQDQPLRLVQGKTIKE